jgi:hypothetical protein
MYSSTTQTASAYYGSGRWWADQLLLCLMGLVGLGVGGTAFAWIGYGGAPAGWDNSPASWLGMTYTMVAYWAIPVLGVSFVIVGLLRTLLPRVPSRLKRPLPLMLFGAGLGVPSALLIITPGASEQVALPYFLSGLIAGSGLWLAVGAGFRIPGQRGLSPSIAAAAVGIALAVLQLAMPVLHFVAAAGAWRLIQRRQPAAAGLLLLATSTAWTGVITADLFRPGVPAANYVFAVSGWLATAAGAALLTSAIIGPGLRNRPG